METERCTHLQIFYSILADLESKLGGTRHLAACSGQMNWPLRGVYFFREDGEDRADSGNGPRIVRVGTHALTATSRTSLWNRLSQHRGRVEGGGNHRGSIFRKLVGAALVKRDRLDFPTWGNGNTANGDVRNSERALECRVSEIIGQMPFLWLSIDDAARRESMRGYIEKNSIALLSNRNKPSLDLPSDGWLGHHSNKGPVTQSGLWNQHHVNEPYDPVFLQTLDRLVSATAPL
jgi:hypothetical protein